MPPIFCATLLALCILLPFAACKLPLSSHRHPPKNVPSFSFTTHKPVSIPLRIAVVLVGFDGTGQSAVTLNPVELEEYLYTVLPARQPHDLNTGHLLHVQYQMWYSVTTVHHKHADKLYAALASSIAPSASARVRPLASASSSETLPMYDVPIHGHVTDVLDELYTDYVHRVVDPSVDAQMHDASSAIFLLNPARKRFFPRDARLIADDSSGGNSFAYRYVSKHSAGPFACWIGSKKYVVADFAAGPVQYGSARDGDGAVSPQMPVWSGGYSDLARLLKVVDSALVHVLAPDVYGHESVSHNIFVPVVAFADHPHPSSGPEDILGHANFDLHGAITTLKTGIPWMTIDTSTSTHALQHNPVVAKAVGASLRPVRTAAMNFNASATPGGSATSKTFHEQLHLGSKKFFGELKNSESVWSLMADGAGGGGGVNATRICPIFVLSLKNLADPYLVDGRSVTATHGDGSIIITGSSNTDLPFFTNEASITCNTNHMSHTVMATLLTATTGLPAPNVRFKGEDGRQHSDFTWSHGFHPFPPFSNNTRLSAAVIDSARRSSVLQLLEAAFVKAFAALHLIDGLAAEFLYDPLGGIVSDKLQTGSWVDKWFNLIADRAVNASDSPLPFVTVRRIHAESAVVEQSFVAAAAAISANGVTSAVSHALDAYAKASSLLAFADVEVERARLNMRCCKLQHSAVNDSLAHHPLAFVVIGALAISCFYGLHLTWSTLNNSRHRKASLHMQ